MSLPDQIAVKFNLYTLACHELLNQLPQLEAATRPDPRLDCGTCIQRFDESLRDFFERSSADTLQVAVRQFGAALLAQAGYFRNRKADAVFRRVVDAISAKASPWKYQKDLERFHVQGREFARHFFADSTWSETKRRLGCSCNLEIEYDSSPSFSPLAYSGNNMLRMHFGYRFDFTHYVALPFLFLHEYSAHIYATEDERCSNERFNDGWLLYAAAAFLKQEWHKSPERVKLSSRQTEVFFESLYHTLTPKPRDTCCFVRQFDEWLSGPCPKRFRQLTYELAAFEPKTGEKAYWPTKFINSLEYEFSDNKRRKILLKKIRDSATARELMTFLTPI
jgi:hypothetical protein